MKSKKIIEYYNLYSQLSTNPAVWKYKDKVKIKELKEIEKKFCEACYEYYQNNINEYYDIFIVKTRDEFGISPLTILKQTQKYMIEYLNRNEDDVQKEINTFIENRKKVLPKWTRH